MGWKRGGRGGGGGESGRRMVIYLIINAIRLPTYSSWKYPGIIARLLGWRCGLRKSDHTLTDESRS